MTQGLIANMLGVRREGVTEGALKLQKADLIRYSRGHITILNREGLENRTCECYAVVKREYDRLYAAKYKGLGEYPDVSDDWHRRLCSVSNIDSRLIVLLYGERFMQGVGQEDFGE